MTVLRDLLLDSRDGEWGKGEPFAGGQWASVIRGTDFAAARTGDVLGVPNRVLEERHLRRKVLTPNDIIIETAGGTKDQPTGRTLFVTERLLNALPHPAVCASFARFLRIDPAKANPRYVFWLLQDHYLRRELLRFHTQHTGVARFQFTTFADTYEFELPTPNAQRYIADILTAYDDLIEVNQRRIAILEEMARRLFDEWFVRPLWERLPIPGDRLEEWMLPDGWRFCPLSETAEITMGQSPSSSDYSIENDGIPFHQGVTDFEGRFHRNRLFLRSDFSWKRVAEKGDILFSVRAPVGRIAIALEELALGRGLCGIRDRAGHQAFLLAHLLVSFPNSDMFGDGTIYKAVTKDDVHSIPIVRPSGNLREMFDKLAGPMWEQLRTLTVANTRLRAARDLLLPKLICGDIKIERVEEVFAEAAE